MGLLNLCQDAWHEIRIWYNYISPDRYFSRKLVRDFKNEYNNNIILIHSYGPRSFYTLKRFNKRCGGSYELVTLYAYEGPEDIVSEEFMEKVRDLYKTKSNISVGELKNIYLSGVIRD